MNGFTNIDPALPFGSSFELFRNYESIHVEVDTQFCLSMKIVGFHNPTCCFPLVVCIHWYFLSMPMLLHLKIERGRVVERNIITYSDCFS